MIFTGLILAQIYNPLPTNAYQTLQAIQQFEWSRYFRSLHYWTAQGVVAAILLHTVYLFVAGTGSYPRRLIWWVGIALLATLTMGSYFSGTVLRWDQTGSDALHHYKEILWHLGPLGAFLSESLQGSSPLNLRTYVSHIALFPIILIGLFAIYFFLIRTCDLSTTHLSTMKGDCRKQPTIVILTSVAYYGLLAILAFFVPASLSTPPVGEMGSTKPPWPFLWVYGFENRWGMIATLYASMGLFGLLASVPLIDRGPSRGGLSRKTLLMVGACFGITLVALSVYGSLAPPQIHGHRHVDPHEIHPQDNHRD